MSDTRYVLTNKKTGEEILVVEKGSPAAKALHLLTTMNEKERGIVLGRFCHECYAYIPVGKTCPHER